MTEPLNHPSGKPPDNKKSDPLGKENRKRQTKNTRSHPYASKTGRGSTRVEDLEVRKNYLESTMGKDGNPIADFDPFGEVIGSYQKKGILLVEEGDYRLGIR